MYIYIYVFLKTTHLFLFHKIVYNLSYITSSQLSLKSSQYLSSTNPFLDIFSLNMLCLHCNCQSPDPDSKSGSHFLALLSSILQDFKDTLPLTLIPLPSFPPIIQVIQASLKPKESHSIWFLFYSFLLRIARDDKWKRWWWWCTFFERL